MLIPIPTSQGEEEPLRAKFGLKIRKRKAFEIDPSECDYPELENKNVAWKI